MKTNMGVLDRIVRAIFALVVLVLYLSHQLSGTAFIILAVLSIVFLITAFIGFCPLYVPLKINTKK